MEQRPLLVNKRKVPRSVHKLKPLALQDSLQTIVLLCEFTIHKIRYVLPNLEFIFKKKNCD